MTPTDLLPLLAKLTRQIQTLQSRNLEHLGLGTGQAIILREIIGKYGITQDGVARTLNLDKSTVARAVQRLEEAGYVEKKQDPSDRRSHFLLSTNMARVLHPQFEMADQSLAEALTMDILEGEIEQFGNFLRRASASVHHVLHSPPKNRISWMVRNKRT